MSIDSHILTIGQVIEDSIAERLCHWSWNGSLS